MSIGNSPQSGMPQRDKYWEERNADEKIDALRGTVVLLSRRVQTLERFLAQLMAHTHGTDGALLGPIRMGGENDSGGYAYNPACHLLTERERQRS